MWPSATGRIGLLLAILFVVLCLIYLRHVRTQQRDPFVISNDALIERNQKGVKCPKGSFCPPLSGKAFLCPGGTYGDKEGLITAACSGLCEPGYICDAGSVSKTAKQCPGGYYCIAGTASVGPITPTICPEGYFCPAGSPAPQKCGEMETCPEGTGACPPGNTACGAPALPTTQPQSQSRVSAPLPSGSYIYSCSDCNSDEITLTCRCRTTWNAYIKTSIKLSTEKNTEYCNNNGSLQYGKC